MALEKRWAARQPKGDRCVCQCDLVEEIIVCVRLSERYEAGVRIGMVANGMPAAVDVREDVRVTLGMTANDKKRGLNSGFEKIRS